MAASIDTLRIKVSLDMKDLARQLRALADQIDPPNALPQEIRVGDVQPFTPAAGFPNTYTTAATPTWIH